MVALYPAEHRNSRTCSEYKRGSPNSPASPPPHQCSESAVGWVHNYMQKWQGKQYWVGKGAYTRSQKHATTKVHESSLTLANMPDFMAEQSPCLPEGELRTLETAPREYGSSVSVPGFTLPHTGARGEWFLQFFLFPLKMKKLRSASRK